MSKLKVKDQKKFFTRIGSLFAVLLLVIFLLVLVDQGSQRDKEVPEVEMVPLAEIQTYQGPFVDLKALPQGVLQVMPKGFNYPKDGVKGLYVSAFAAG